MRMDIPYLACVQKIVSADEEKIVAERMMDDGHDVVEVRFPVLLTVVKDINEPRVPSLKGKMKAKKAVITNLSADDIEADPGSIGLPGSPTQVVKVFPPEPRGEKAVFTGTIDEQIDQLVEKIKPYL